jgi:predicted ATPase
MEVDKMKKYVLTGGPGTGKSSIILSLEAKGEYVIREGAEDYIRLRQAAGAKTPWTEPDFQDRILDLQLQREARVPKGATRVFIDRGVADGLAYAKEGTETYKRIEDAGKITRYDKIFSI